MKTKRSAVMVALSAATVLNVPSAIAVEANHHDHAGHTHGDKPIYGHVHVLNYMDHVTGSGSAKSNYNEVYNHSHADIGARLGEGFSINAGLRLHGEPAGHHHGGGAGAGAVEEEEHEHEEEHEEGEQHEEGEEYEEGEHAHLHGGGPDGSDNIFEDHPLAIEQLTLNYDSERFSAYVGKFNPVVGFAYHRFPGVYGYQAIEEYALREKLGIGGAAKHNAGDYGTHRLDVSTFFADTTFLSDSVLYQRGHTSKVDGGLANTEDFSSFAVSIGGSDFYSLTNNIVEGLSYRVGYAKQAAGIGNDDDETRASMSLGHQQQITQGISGEVLVEHVAINHYNGEADHDRDYSTASFRLDIGQWNVGTSYTAVHNDAPDAVEGAEGSIYQLSAGYRFENGIGIDAGWQNLDEENETNNRFGVAVSYGFEF